MTPREYLNRLLNAKRLYEQQRINLALQLSSDLLALVKLRNQTKGEDSEGVKYVPYSKDYAERGRKKLGYQSEYVDFTRRGRLWNNIKAKVTTTTNSTVSVVIKADLANEQTKLNGQARKRGNILTPSKYELQIAQLADKQRRLKIINV